MSGPALACVRIGSGARALEEDLLARLEADLAELRGPPLDLARPLRVVVPSASLREHLASALVRRAGRGLVGLRVQTLAGLAREVLERAGERAAPVEGLLGVLVARAARAEPALLEALGALRAGFELLAESASDLLDAGLGPEHAEALDELITEGGPALEVERARAVVRVALEAQRQLAELGCAREGDLLARATALVEERGGQVLAVRALRVHGFADATGRAADLIAALLRAFPTRVWLDVPSDPWSESDPPARLEAFSARLRERLCSAAPAEPIAPRSAALELRLRAAARPEEEVRAVARDVRALLDARVPAEGIAVIARELEPWALLLRTHFARLAIPFSGVGRRGPAAACGRQLASLLELVRETTAFPVERWLEMLQVASPLGALEYSARADLATACHVLGASRIGELARLDLAAELGGSASLRLPVRTGVGEGAAGAERGPQLAQRRVQRGALERLQRAARQCVAWSERARAAALPARDHAPALLQAAEGILGWRDASPAWAALHAALAALERVLPAALRLELPEFASLLARALEDSLHEPLGGNGAGVQVLDVMEARARCFDHVFVLGMTRDAFPRALREDALLCDSLRARMAWLLPDLPIRARARDEERHLFAQLLSASPRVTLSHAARAAGGELQLPSSFFGRFALAGLPVENAPVLAAPDAALGPRTAHEHAVLAGLHGGVDALPGRLALALAESGPTQLSAPAALERARIAVLRELEEGEAALGPYFGFVGPLRSARDPRRAALHVTTLEALARCPWQTFLTRVLRVGPPVDALADLPELQAQRIGKIIHSALERIARELGAAVRADLAELAGAAGRPLRWPSNSELDAILEAAVGAVLRDEGIRLAGLSQALARSLRPRLDAAGRLLQERIAAGDVLLGAEVEGSIALGAALAPRGAGAGATPPGDSLDWAGRALHFRADWVLRGARGLELLDFKTGRCFSSSMRTRDAQRAAAVASGRYLQAVLYGMAGGAGALGAYAFLDPALSAELAHCAMPHAEGPLAEHFARAVAVLAAAHAEGVFAPRMQEPGSDAEPTACRFCEVSEACLRSDLTARTRFGRALEAGPPHGGPTLLHELLSLPEPPR